MVAASSPTARARPAITTTQEAVRRRRAEATWGDRYVARLLGLGLRQTAYERGRRFIKGVLERAGRRRSARCGPLLEGCRRRLRSMRPGSGCRLELPEPG